MQTEKTCAMILNHKNDKTIKRCHKTTPVQAYRGFRLLPLASMELYCDVRKKVALCCSKDKKMCGMHTKCVRKYCICSELHKQFTNVRI